MSSPDTGAAGRTVLVTGAAGGLGGPSRSASPTAATGSRWPTCSRGRGRDRRPGPRRGAAAWHGRLDVTDPASAAEVAAAVADFGGGVVDVLVNNAAVYATLRRAPFEEIDPDEWDRVMAVNSRAPWLMVRALSPHLPEGGRVVNLASATVYSGSEQWAHYVASKGGVIALTRVMAKELGRRSITVNAIAPGSPSPRPASR